MKNGFILIACLLSACSAPPQHVQRITLTDGERTISLQVEIADEPEEYARGLMGRESLPEGHGMLFAFDDESPRAFWMKNTHVPLDILFFNQEGVLVSAHTMVPCDNDPCSRTFSGGPAMYALEVNAGFVQKYRIGEKWTLNAR